MTPKEKAEKIVMLTPTQEAMQWVWQQRKSTNSKDAISALDAVYQHLQKVTLHKEKEVAQQYAEFAVLCYRSELPVLEFDGWVNF